MRKYVGFLAVGLALVSMVMLRPTAIFAAEHKAVEVTWMSTPFGTPMYSQAVAFEEVFKKVNSWVHIKAQETPGAMYIAKYMFQNHDKMAAGKVNQVLAPSSIGVLPFLVEGRKPFDKLQLKTAVAMFSMPSYVMLYVTFNPNIKSLRDFAGKKVGIAERARVFQSTLPNKPYFEKGLGIWDKVKWQYLGAINSKDALLNNKIDAHYATFMGGIEIAPDGTYICRKMAPGPAVMELLNSGRKLYILSWDPEIIKKSYDFSKDMISYPILVKKGACQGIDRDVWARLSVGLVSGDASMPDDVLQEIIRVRHEYRKELAKYHATLNFLPANPYPLGTPEKYVHPGVKKAMKALGIPIPK